MKFPFLFKNKKLVSKNWFESQKIDFFYIDFDEGSV